MNNNMYYQTADISLVAFLKLKEFPILKVCKSERNKIFYFEDTPLLHARVSSYFNDEKIKISPRRLLIELRLVKNLLYADKDVGKTNAL